jgi:hypothetical protein
MSVVFLLAALAIALVVVNLLTWTTPEDDHERRFRKYWKDEER